jgi:hypothetical protein
MKRRVHVEMRATTQTRANAHRTWLAGQIAGRLLSDEDQSPLVERDDGSAWMARAQTRFVTGNEADIFYQAVVAKMAADSTVAAGSEVHWHDCSHDEVNPQPCVIGGRTVK